MAVVPLKIGMLTRIIVGVEEDIERNLEPVLDLFRIGIDGDIGRDHAEYRRDAVAAARLIGFDIGSATCRERVCPSVENTVFDLSFNNNTPLPLNHPPHTIQLP